MAFKGVIRAGATVEAKLLLDHTAAGSAFLFMGYGRPGGKPEGSGETAEPGGFAKATQQLDERGRLEVAVDMSSESDTGVLLVSVNGPVKTKENIRGDTLWVYHILAPAAAPAGARP